MYIEVKQLLLMESNIQTVIIWGNRGTCTTPSGHVNRKNHIPHSSQSICQGMNTARTAQSLLKKLLKSPAALWPGSSTTSRVRSAKPTGDHKHCGPCSSALALCEFMPMRENDCPTLMYGLTAAGRWS